MVGLSDELEATVVAGRPRLIPVSVFASGGLDEADIDRLVTAGAPIDAFGIGTRMGVPADAPYLDSVPPESETR